MTLLVIGLVLWVAGHFFKRLLPGLRTGMGDAGKGVSAAIILAGVVAMVVGYRGSDFVPVYDPPSWGIHLNNLLMLVVVFLFGLGSSKSPLRSSMRHPMLTGTALWGVAHLLANGDLHSIVLFGGILIWALAEIALINAKEPVYERFQGGSSTGTVRLIVITLFVYAVIAAIHWGLGVRPFPG